MLHSKLPSIYQCTNICYPSVPTESLTKLPAIVLYMISYFNGLWNGKMHYYNYVTCPHVHLENFLSIELHHTWRHGTQVSTYEAVLFHDDIISFESAEKRIPAIAKMGKILTCIDKSHCSVKINNSLV